MRLFVVGCVALLMGICLGVYGACAASTIKYTTYLSAKDVPAKSDQYMLGYVSGTYDTLAWVTWTANDDPKAKDDFTPEYFAKAYLCLQKIPDNGETVAFAKGYWAANPNYSAANVVVLAACEYKPGQARSSTITRGASTGHTQTATFRSSK